MDKTRYIERILETENLTDNLEDDDANVLLDWGLSRLDVVIGETGDEEVAGTQILALMNIMRTINRIIGNFPNSSSEGVQDFIKWYDAAFATTHGTDAIEYETIAAQLTDMSPAGALLFLLTWLPSSKSTDLPVEQGE
ncbi:MAG: hypothetical protein NTW32_08930 [Chloroflexi bacterium]|nr:hypothetical protein [Chloroflexota bacterium]